MEFVLDKTPWDFLLESVKPGSAISALACLSALEAMTEEEAEDALLGLEEQDVVLDIADLPKSGFVGEAAIRLQLEQKLAESGQLLRGLQENDPLRLYLTELTAMDGKGNVKALAQAYLDGDDTAIEPLAEQSLSLVVERACSMTGRGVLLMDLIQEGSLGLWQGILHYTGGDFNAYISRWIDHYLAKTVLLQALSQGVGQKLRQGMEDYRDADQRLLGELGRNPTREELAAALHISVEEVMTLEGMLSQAKLRQQVEQVKAPREEEPEDSQAVEDTAYFQIRQRITGMLATLPEREAKILSLRFGLDDDLPRTPEQTGAILGLTPDEVVTLEAAALKKLRQQGE